MPLYPTSDNDNNSEGLDPRRKMLRYRAWHRGTREADLLIGPFADAHVRGFDERTLGVFESLLNVADDKLTAWIMNGDVAPAPYESELLAHMRRFQFEKR